MRATVVALILATLGSCGGDAAGPGHPVPEITAVHPTTVPVGETSVPIGVAGRLFTPASRVRVNGSERETTWGHAGGLNARLSAEDVSAPGVLRISVHTPPPGGGTSLGLEIVVAHEAPFLSAFEPAAAEAGDGPLTLTIHGLGFHSDAVVRWDGSDRATTWLSERQLLALITDSDLLVGGRFAVSVHQPGTQPSSDVEFVVRNPAPSFVALHPGHVFAGRGPVTLEVEGTDFLPGLTLLWDGTARPATWLSSDRLRLTIPSADISVPRTVSLVGLNPDPAVPSADTLWLSVHDEDRYLLPFDAGGVAWDPLREVMYVSGRSSDPIYANQVVALDPATGEVVAEVSVGSEPSRMAISDDAAVLYVALDGAAAVQPIDLSSFTPRPAFPLSGNNGEILWAADLQVMPGTSETLAVSHMSRLCNNLGCWFAPDVTVALYDSGHRRGPVVHGGSALTFAGPEVLFGFDGVSSGHDLVRITPEIAGLTVVEIMRDLIYGYYADIAHMNGLVFSSNGPVVDPVARQRVAELNHGGALAVDPATRRVFFLMGDTLVAYDGETLELLGSEQIEGVPPFGTPSWRDWELIRWGFNGFAYRTDDGVVIIRSDLAVP